MNLRDIRLRVRALLMPRRTERDLDDELSFHLEMETRKLIASGLSEEDARKRARAHFGSAPAAAEECRDARRIAFIGATLRDIAYAFRTFRSAPVAALTIIGTVALGLGLSAVAFTIFNAFVFRTDAVRDPGSLYGVERVPPNGSSDRIRFNLRQYEALSRETDVFSESFASLPDITLRIGGRMMEGHLVTGNFFQVLGVGAALGRTLTPADGLRGAGHPVIVLSDSGWSRLYARDPNAIGGSVVVNGFRYEIVGVAPEGFRGLGVAAPDYWAPLSLVGQFRPYFAGREDNLGVDVTGRLKPGVSPEAARAALTAWAAHNAAEQAHAGVLIESRRTAAPLSPRVLLAFLPLFFAFGLILMIGCANVANLLLARAVVRQREIGIRLSLGASRGRVVRQLLTESLLLALASAACALVISRVVLDATVSALVNTMPPELGDLVHLAAPGTDWRVAVFVVAAAAISTVFFGLLPAMQATRLDLVRVARGEWVRLSRPGHARNVLIAAQVTASALFLICAGHFLRGAQRAAEADPGFRTEDSIVVEIVNEPFRAAMTAAVADEPSVVAVAASWPELMNRPRPASGSAAGTPAKSPVAYRLVSPEYFSVLDIDVLKGRVFTQAEAVSNAAVAMVSEATARQIWPNRDAAGQVLRLELEQGEAALPSETFLVIGVVHDVAGFRIAGYAEAGVYLPASPAAAETALIARVHGDPELARRALLERLTSIDPSMGQVITMRTLARLETYPLQVAFWLTVVLGGLALVLTLSGIFSVSSYLVEQRAKEIGVRVALGATAWGAARVVLSQSLWPVAAGLAVGSGLAWSLTALLMSSPAAGRIGGIIDLFDPLVYSGSLLFIVAACAFAISIPALRAALIDPIATLRQE